MEQSDLPGSFRALLQRLHDHFKALDKQVDEMDAKRSRHRHRLGGIDWRCQQFQERAATGGVAGVGAEAALKRGEIDPVGHQQARRHVPANVADSRSAGRDSVFRNQAGDQLAQQAARPTQQEYRCGGVGEQNARIVWALLTRDEQRFRTDYAPAVAGA